MKKTISALCVGVTLLSSSCATVHIVSLTNPKVETKYSSVVVFLPTADLIERAALEQSIAGNIARYKVKAYLGMTVISPTENVEPKELLKVLNKRGFETVLLIRSSNSSTQQTYIPQQIAAGPGYFQTYGGYSFETFSRGLNLELVATDTQERVWMGTVKASSSDSSGDVIRIIGDAVAKDLAEKGVISPATQEKTNKTEK